MDAFHPGKVNHQAIVNQGQAGCVVAAGPHRDRQVVIAGKSDSQGYILGRLAADDEGRAFVNRAVPELAGLVVVGIAAADQLAAQVDVQFL
ncbi:MAG: hypothetical protein Fur0044_02080 [Anaerolineae bacterium]